MRVAPLTTLLPTLIEGSGRSCVIETISDGALCGSMSICDPKRCPATTNGVTPTTVPSTGEKTLVPGGAPTSSADVAPPSSWYQVGCPPPPPKILWKKAWIVPSFRSETISDGALCGSMSICDPKRCPATTNGVTPTTVPSTGEKTLVPGGAPTSSADVAPPSSWYQVGCPPPPPKILWKKAWIVPSF